MSNPRIDGVQSRLIRQAAIERLEREYGIKVSRFRRSTADIAALIETATDRKVSGDPEMVIQLFTGMTLNRAPLPERFLGTGRPYKPSRQMAIAAQRAQDQPPMIGMSSTVRHYAGFEP